MHFLTTEKQFEKPLNIAIVASSFYTVRNNDNYEFDLVNNAIFAFDSGLENFNQNICRSLKDIFQNTKISNSLLEEFSIAAKINLQIIIVPGAMELPQACQWLIDKGNIDGILAVGCVVRGKTTHYDHVCHTAISGLGTLALQTKTPIATAIVTAENDELAKERVLAEYNGKPAKNLGFWGMKALLDMITLKNSFYQKQSHSARSVDVQRKNDADSNTNLTKSNDQYR